MKIGVVVRLGAVPGNDGAVRYPSFRDIRDVARRLESAGFDSAWVFDHLLYRESGASTGIWEGWTMLSAIAAVTETIELGPLVACTHFRNPALLAKMAVTLDEISGGRLVLGLGAGWNAGEFDAFGIPFDHRVDRFAEALRIIVPLLRTGHVDFHGQYFSASHAELIPRGPRPHGPPLLIGGWGPRMLDLVLTHADTWNGGYAGTFGTFEENLGRFERARANAAPVGAHIDTSALVKIGWPDLAPVPEFFEGQYITGTPLEIANAFAAYAAAGVSDVMCQYHPNTLEALDRLTAALHTYRSLSAHMTENVPDDRSANGVQKP